MSLSLSLLHYYYYHYHYYHYYYYHYYHHHRQQHHYYRCYYNHHRHHHRCCHYHYFHIVIVIMIIIIIIFRHGRRLSCLLENYESQGHQLPLYQPGSRRIMMTSSNGNIFSITGPLWGDSAGDRWIPPTKANDAELWSFLWSVPEQMVEQTIETPVIWGAIAPPLRRHCNVFMFQHNEFIEELPINLYLVC